MRLIRHYVTIHFMQHVYLSWTALSQFQLLYITPELLAASLRESNYNKSAKLLKYTQQLL